MTNVDHLTFATITVYMKRDIAEVSRVLQLMVRQPVVIERFSAQLVAANVRGVKGLDRIDGPVMRLAIVGATDSNSDLERAVKALNRLVTVYKVTAQSN